MNSKTSTLVGKKDKKKYIIEYALSCPFDVSLKVSTLEWSGMRKVGLSKDQEKMASLLMKMAMNHLCE